MKKVLLLGLMSGIICATAHASDGLHFTETTEWTIYETVNVETVTFVDDAYVAPRPAAAKPAPAYRSSRDLARAATPHRGGDVRRPCPHKSGEPVHVKTHTEIIDHYQMYQPVTVYEPAGTYSRRRVEYQPAPCTRCAR
ncbi:MAG: hypothetical protein K2L95_03770 [Alphaproteobacteria bacterium]|nr:hypothetical protein [Alphaproteobacteria bacterium]